VKLSHILGARLTDGGQAPCGDNHGVADSRELGDGGMYEGSQELGGSSELGSSRELEDSWLPGSHTLVRGRVSVDH